jgi:hypothetical protein
MTPSFSPEFLLTAACAMWPPCDLRTEAIRTATAGPLDWGRFLRVVRRHGVLGLVHDGLKRARPDVPPDIAAEISSQSKILVCENLAMAAEAARLQRLFDDAGLSVLFLKGASLALLAFGDVGLRSAKDIDLLISPEIVPGATALVERAGYRRFDPPPNASSGQLRLLMSLRRDLGFIHETSGHQIELHWQLFSNPYAMDVASIRSASQVVPLTKSTGLRTLGPEDLYTYLCVHGAYHRWNQLKWLSDIGALLAAAPEGGVERLNRAAEVRGARHAAVQAILLCHRILGTPLPARLMTELDQGTRVRWLQATAVDAMTAGSGERGLHDVPFGTTRGSLSAFLLRQNWRYCLAELRNLVINQNDVLEVPLPKGLWFLYPILRLPLWIRRHAKQSDVN